jgi:hypothetical protein
MTKLDGLESLLRITGIPEQCRTQVGPLKTLADDHFSKQPGKMQKFLNSYKSVLADLPDVIFLCRVAPRMSGYMSNIS